MDNSFDVVVVGTGFASSFFLFEYLKHAKPNEKILVLEKGNDVPYSWKIENESNTDFGFRDAFNNLTPSKVWIQNIAFGGGACWTGNTPRMHPSDFKTRSLHGVGEDWPFDYFDFDPYVTESEDIMGISGVETSEYPRSKPYPMPAHKLNALDRLLKAKYEDEYMPMPSARASDYTKGRAKCCNNGVCSVCPIAAKFQVDLHMRSLYSDPRITLKIAHDVTALNIENSVAKSVSCIHEGKEKVYKANLFAVGAHAIMTPFILLNSGLQQFALGRYISEQVSVDVRVNLDNVDNYDGGQRVSGMGSMFMNEANRSEFAGCMVEGYNIPWLRAEFGKWRHTGVLKFVFEDLPNAEKRVTLGSNGKPDVYYGGLTPYIKDAIADLPRRVESLLEGLPIEDYVIATRDDTNIGSSAHIQGSTRMGKDPATSVVDENLINHEVRNMAVLGSGAFPTCAAANPTLILSALSLKSARSLFT